ncbi:hypothetical protein AYL99_09803 [Fonsecaea erecta]|uniref:Uncharacterized protein n=1 Tax=Fonsecaea erecta TaxID=1367422 RepID=A0A178Z840_9EURO|nr:hypothetical protein AYL99_09803 [Fonsecaea erecta]OAP55651.1 hypothetical protein AYL99_09803 [Fonsecaea erecta]
MNSSNAARGTETDSDESTPFPVTPPRQIIHPFTSSSSSNGADLTVWALDQIYSSCFSDDPRGWDRTRAFLGNLSPHLRAVVSYFPDSANGEYWTPFPLSNEDFECLKRSKFHADEDLKYDYDALFEILVFRMPEPHAHSHVQVRLAYKIVAQLEAIAEHNDTVKPFINRLYASILSPFECTDSERHPDFSAHHLSQPKPAVIGEVALLETGKNLDRLADEYHFELRSYINVVFGLRFGFWKNENGHVKISAMLSTWRPVLRHGLYVGSRCEDVMLYDEFGNKIVDEHAGLRLSLEDFAFFRLPTEFPGLDQYTVFVSVEELQEMLGEAAEIHQAYGWTRIP